MMLLWKRSQTLVLKSLKFKDSTTSFWCVLFLQIVYEITFNFLIDALFLVEKDFRSPQCVRLFNSHCIKSFSVYLFYCKAISTYYSCTCCMCANGSS